MEDKVEFASQAWLDKLHELIGIYARKVGGNFSLSLCEVFTAVPRHLDPDGSGTISWHCRIRDGDVKFSRGEIFDADYKSTADYAYILPYARRILDPKDAAAIEKEHEAAVAAGKLKREGDRTKIPLVFYGMHNDIARLTR